VTSPLETITRRLRVRGQRAKAGGTGDAAQPAGDGAPERPNGAIGEGAVAGGAAAGSGVAGSGVAGGAMQPSASATPGDAKNGGAGKRLEEAQTCANCHAGLQDEQEWCTQCGERRRRRARAGWYSAGVLTAGSAILASGAAAAGVAALTQGSAKEPPHHLLAPAPAASVPATPATPGSPETLKVPRTHVGTGLGSLGNSAGSTSTAAGSSSSQRTRSSSTATPTGGGTAAPGSSSTTSSTTSTHTSSSSSASGKPEAIELHARELSIYDPDKLYPGSSTSELRKGFRDRFDEGLEVPYWTFTVPAGKASSADVGLLIDFGHEEHVGSVELHLSHAFALEAFGANNEHLPRSAPTPSRSGGGWTYLGTSSVKRHSVLKLSNTSQSFRYLLLWVAHVPEKLAGSKLSLEEIVPETP
jgi:hypothetical protein